MIEDHAVLGETDELDLLQEEDEVLVVRSPDQQGLVHPIGPDILLQDPDVEEVEPPVPEYGEGLVEGEEDVVRAAVVVLDYPAHLQDLAHIAVASH